MEGRGNVGGGGSFLAYEDWGEGLTIYSPPAVGFFVFFSGDQLAHINSTF